EHVEGLSPIGVPTRRRGRLPDAGPDPGEHVLELALGLAERPPVGVGSEREDLALAIDPEAQAVRGLAVFPFVHADLASRALLHPDLLTRDVGPDVRSAASAACDLLRFRVIAGLR